MATHAQAKAFLETPKPAPRSYAGIAYYGVNAFQFINDKGQLHVGRYRIEPMLASGVLSSSQAAAMPEDYLQEELAARLAAGPIRLRLVLQLATARDNSADGSIAWPASNPQLELGEITLERLVPAADQLQQQQRMGFNPGNLPDGISPSADPMIKARQGIYQRALQRRGITSPAGD
ncbi:catalase [Pseudomonas sp. REB1044]|uniref:catalase n=1 Tax=Pseudomonas sp. REB1044 TaxID=2675224 RepID=UPI00315D05C6